MIVEARFWAKVNKTDTCWLWTAAVTSRGYGSWRAQGDSESLAHRWSYRFLVAPIPAGLTIDHVRAWGCTSKLCVNPAHMEVCTQKVNNSRRSQSLVTHCPHGHEYAGHNLYVNPRGQRQCRECLNYYKRGMRLAAHVERALKDRLQQVA